MKKTYFIISMITATVAINACKTQQIKKSNRSIEREAVKKSGGISIPNTAQTYINTYKDIAIKEMNEYGIPASITLAQGIMESSFGNSDLAKYANNHFGIKCTSTWKGKGYFKDDDQKNDCFRVYKNALESYRDHSEFLKRKRYAGLFQLDKNDYKGWAKGLKEAGYATNPNYANLLISSIEKYNLTQYDQVDTEKAKIARQDKIFGDINSEMAKEDSKYTPVSSAPKGIVTTEEAEERVEKENTALSENVSKSIPIANSESVLYKGTKKSQAVENKPADPNANTYAVQTGDGLYRIARVYSLSVDRLKEINHLTTDEIQVGQVLIVKDDGSVPVGSGKVDTANVEAPKTEATTTIANKEIPVAGVIPKAKVNENTAEDTSGKMLSEVETTSTYYTVQAGDTFYKIAKEFNITVDELKGFNQAAGDDLKVGQEIKISEAKKNIYKPAPVKTVLKMQNSDTKEASKTGTYTVQKGDSLFKIAKTFHLTLDEIRTLNKMTSDALQVGQTLKVSK